MAVIVLTDICSMNCSYCFYSEVLLQKKAEMFEKKMLPEKIKEKIFFDANLIRKLADKLVDSQLYTKLGKKTVVITWWEPTLHPEFESLMRFYISKWLNIHLLSNFWFQPNWDRANFLKKNREHFKFLVNLNEPSEQKNAVNTIKNLIDIDDDKIKIWLNIFHKDFNFDPLFEVLHNTKNIKIIRFWLPNPQANEWISMWPYKEMKKRWWDDILDLYEKDLLADDIDYIIKNDKPLPYWLTQPRVFEYYQELWNEIQKMVNRLKKEWFSDRVEFYVDCWFDMKFIPDDALWFINNRLFHKNPCSIPNGWDIMIWWRVDQCYTLLNWWNWSDKINVKNYSIRDINSYYFMSSILLSSWLLWPDLKWEMCRANSVRYFMQLFTKGKLWSWTFPLKDPQIVYLDKYPLKDLDLLINTYYSLYKDKKDIWLIRLLQLVEFLICTFKFDEWLYVLNKIYNITKKPDNKMYSYRLHYYKLICEFANNIVANTVTKNYVWIDDTRKKYVQELEQVRKFYNSKYWSIPEKHLEILDKWVDMIIKRWIYIQ